MKKRLLRVIYGILGSSIGLLSVGHTQGFDCTDVLDVSISECEALVSLYDGLQGDQRSDTAGWKQSNTVSDRYGITVQERNGSDHVVQIALTDNGLIGQIPGGVGTFSHLELLDVSSNTVTGLPMSIETLDALVFLDISDTTITTLPSTIATLDTLSILDISNTLLTSLPDMSGLIGLDQFSCRYSDLTTLPASLIELPELDSIDCRWSEVTQVYGTSSKVRSLLLTSSKVHTLGPIAFPRITTLKIDKTPLTSIEIVGDMSELEWLDVGETSLTSIENLLGSMPVLKYLYIDKAELNELSDVSSLLQLQELRFNTNQLTILPTGIQSLTELEALYAWSNELQGTIPDEWSDLENTQYVYLSDNALDRMSDHTAKKSQAVYIWSQTMGYNYNDGNQRDSTPPLVEVLSEIPFFQTGTSITLTIDLEENSYLTDESNSGLMLSREGEGLCDTLPQSVLDENGQQEILLTVQPGIYENCEMNITDHGNNTTIIQLRSRVVGEGYSDLCSHPDISVSVSECEALVDLYGQTQGDQRYTNHGWFESPDVDTRHGVDVTDGHVVGLYLHKTTVGDQHGSVSSWDGNNLQGTFPQALFSLSYLQQINLSNNRLKGSLQGDRSVFDTLEVVRIYNTPLGGTIDERLGLVPSLRVLQLRNTGLTGSLPQSLKSLENLEVLDLSKNKLSGQLEVRLSDLITLRYINIESNEFTGELPDSLSVLGGLETLYLAENNFVGEIPHSRKELTTQRISLEKNALSRTVDHSVAMSPQILTWYQSHTIRNRGDQDDTTAPVVGTVPQSLERKQIDSFEYRITIQEESYPVDQFDEGMEVVFSGSSICESLTASYVHTGAGEISLSITPGIAGWYEGCELMTEDHGDNVSNPIQLPNFISSQGPDTVCYHPDLTVSREVCLALIDVYESTDGEGWITNTGRGESPAVEDWYGLIGDDGMITGIVLSENGLVGSAIVALDILIDVGEIDLSGNDLESITIPTTQDHGLQRLNIADNQITTDILSTLGDFSDLIELDVSNNRIDSQFPGGLVGLSSLEYLDIHGNTIYGNIDESIVSMTSLIAFDASGNDLVGNIPEGILLLENLEELNISYNALDRDADHTVNTPVSVSGYLSQLTLYSGGYQQDTTAPILTSLSHPQIVEGLLPVEIGVSEGSYTVDATGLGMEVEVLGPGLCSSVQALDTVSRGVGTRVVRVSLLIEGTYEGCSLRITDHGGNQTQGVLNTFESSFRCGNGEIDTGEVCDEGRSCEDGRDCTADPTICPNECEVRLVDNCTPSCTISACGDGVTDSEGLDNIPGTYDDEQCDPGSTCLSTGEACGANPSLCPGGAGECQPRQTQSCTPSCSYGGCGDGFVDLDGLDNILETDDDEGCDLGDLVDGDGCSSSCQLEFCGDGLTDLDGPDNDPSTLGDNELCDEGPHNGVLGGICTSTCQQPQQECLYCYEVCDGGSSDNIIFLVLDTSGSMGDNNKLQKAKDGAIEFVNLVEDRAASNTGFASQIGIIEYWTQADMVVSPTQDYDALRTAITNFYAGGSTNIGGALDVVYDYFQNNPVTASSHVVLLSDGEPTIGTNSLGPVSWAYDRAQALESIGVDIYTISLELSFEGIDIMRTVSSSQIQNIALGKTATQSSTNYRWRDWKSARKAVDNSLDPNYSIAQTENDYQSHWDLDLGSMYEINQLKLWNRTGSHARKTNNYHVMVRSSPFTSMDLQTMLDDPQTRSMHTPGQAGRPTRYDMNGEGRYIRVQQEGSNHFTINELEILGCSSGQPCYDVFSYEDYQGDAIDLIFSHIFGSIHCDCRPEQVCGLCGDGQTYEIYGEECDLGSICPDGSDCTGDDSACPGQCAVVSNQTCTSQCRAPVCGDMIVTSPNTDDILEQCDNGLHCANSSPCTFDGQCTGIGDGLCITRSGDGCSDLCQQESCGDRVVDFNGADNLWDTADDEQCDDGTDNGPDERCLLDCTWNPALAGDPGSCGLTDPLYQTAGNGTLINQSTLGLCDTGTPIDFEYYPHLHSRGWVCQGVQGSDDEQCELSERYCGDQTIDTDAGEQCDDGNQIDGDGCSASCQHETVGSAYAGLGEHCHDTTIPLIVQTNEIVPLTWAIDLVVGIDTQATSCDDIDDDKFIPGGSLQCEVVLPSGSVISVPCLDYTKGSQALFEDVLQDYERDTTRSKGGVIIDAQPVGRHRMVLQNISYTHCDRSRGGQIRAHTMVQSGTVCAMPVGVVEGYRIEKGATLSSSTQSSMSLLDESGNQLFTDDTLNAVQKIQSQRDFESLVDLFLEEFVGDNRWSSVLPAFPWGADQSTKKSLTKRVHFFRGSQTRKAITIDNSFLLNPEKPFSLVVENADLIINGGLEGNGMYIIDGGTVRFENENCDMADVVEGIFVTDEGFETAKTLNQDPYAQQRCKGGNLVINGLFIGSGIDDEFISRRRSLLNPWGLEYLDEATQSLTDGEKKARIRKQGDRIIEGPSVRIDTSPLAWSELPPGVKDLFDVIAVRR